MAKIQKISSIDPTLGFTEFDIFQQYRESFECSELGRLYQMLPLSELAGSMNLRSAPLGRKSYFSAQGKIALMFLKAYTNFSDFALIGHLNGNIHYQLFCGIQIHPKLLWESVEWLYRWLGKHCRDFRIRRPRNKYDEVRRAYLSYSKKRKRKASHTRMLKRRLLHLLEKLIGQTNVLHHTCKGQINLSPDYQKRFSVIKKVLSQGKELFKGEKVTDRIVSIDRHYLRPIVRGKETKAVEFGAKVNNIQIDGISFIEHLSFKAFNEGRQKMRSFEEFSEVNLAEKEPLDLREALVLKNNIISSLK